MINTLIVVANGHKMGQVSQERDGKFTLVYDKQWPSDHAYPLSLSMPLSHQHHHDDVVRPFLQGLLPDNDRVLEHWGQRFGVSARNPFALLAHVGEDCAGAVQFVRPERLAIVCDQNHRQIDWLTEAQVAERLKALYTDDTAWQAPQRAGQFSLAGAQPKIALLYENGQWGVPSGRIPTTHILKPPTGPFDGFAENEHFCLALAQHLGLPTASSQIQRFEDQVAIVIERYDRIATGEGLLRVHQEDCCQALGLSPFRKYENEGGPGIAEIVELLRIYSANVEADLQTFLSTIAFNWIVGATDGHAKNYSILIGPGSHIRLAPLYDIASALPYHQRDAMKLKLAMRVGGEYLMERINKHHWQKLAQENRIPADELLRHVRSVAEHIGDIVQHVHASVEQEGLAHPILGNLEELIVSRATRCVRML